VSPTAPTIFSTGRRTTNSELAASVGHYPAEACLFSLRVLN
jgi:hypothetical protein